MKVTCQGHIGPSKNSFFQSIYVYTFHLALFDSYFTLTELLRKGCEVTLNQITRSKVKIMAAWYEKTWSEHNFFPKYYFLLLVQLINFKKVMKRCIGLYIKKSVGSSIRKTLVILSILIYSKSVKACRLRCFWSNFKLQGNQLKLISLQELLVPVLLIHWFSLLYH